MVITLYKTRSDRKAVNKALADPKTFTVTLKSTIDVDSPVFMLTRPSDDDLLIGYNYLYWEETNSYYYARIRLLQGGIAEISCDVDSLMTHKSEIYGLKCYVERQENVYNPYMVDSVLPVPAGSIIDTKELSFPAGNTRTIYFTCVGGNNDGE